MNTKNLGKRQLAAIRDYTDGCANYCADTSLRKSLAKRGIIDANGTFVLGPHELRSKVCGCSILSVLAQTVRDERLFLVETRVRKNGARVGKEKTASDYTGCLYAPMRFVFNMLEHINRTPFHTDEWGENFHNEYPVLHNQRYAALRLMVAFGWFGPQMQIVALELHKIKLMAAKTAIYRYGDITQELISAHGKSIDATIAVIDATLSEQQPLNTR